jgi:YesN/AraC family two-component response regulator
MTTPKRLRLLLADDQSLFREALRTLLALQPDFEIVAEAENGERAVALARAPGAPGWAEIAREAGYADQAHLIREFRAFAGTTPTALAAAA